jgi:hypothetical protein
MNIRICKLTWWLAVMAGLISPLALQAQTLPFTLTPGSVANASFGIDANGTLTATGPFNSSLTFSFSGAPQMVWFPAFGAFRAGSFYGSQTSIGQDSVAFGSSTASGSYSAAFGDSTASGYDSTAMGYDTTASGGSSVAMGLFSSASGSCSLASGVVSSASGMASTALGQSTASGSYATSAGISASANSYDSFVVGTYNVGLSETLATPNLTAWMAADPLFEVGNGTSSVKSDALVVYKDGSETVKGPITVTNPGGDIPMYAGN